MCSKILSVEQLSFSYSGRNSTFSVSLPELELCEGDFVGLVGSSGSGKSTLLDVLGLVRKPTHAARFEFTGNFAGISCVATIDVGSMWASEDDAGLSNIRSRNLGYVLQGGGLIPFLSVGENIELPCRIAGLPVSRNNTMAAMESIGLDWGYNKPVSDLSGGERQRVAILRAIAHRPRFILADEPTAAVDTRRAHEVVSILAEMASLKGSAVVMVSHDQDLIRKVATRVFVLEEHQGSTARDTRFTAVQENQLVRFSA